MSNIYNENEEKESKLIKDLKELPKVKAPENFEYNLMTRIQNKNFGEPLTEKPKFNFIKFFAPSAVVVTVVLLFFLFLPSANQRNITPNAPHYIENPAVANNSIAPLKKEETLNNSAQISRNKLLSPAPRSSYQERQVNPIDNSRSVRVDDYISGANQNKTDIERGNVVSSGNEPESNNGFFISERPDKNTLEKYRARIDSLKKAQLKADSLKKAQKTR